MGSRDYEADIRGLAQVEDLANLQVQTASLARSLANDELLPKDDLGRLRRLLQTTSLETQKRLRNSLFTGLKGTPSSQGNITKDKDSVAAAQSLTGAMAATLQTLETEIQRSAIAQSALGTSTKTLDKSRTELGLFGVLLGSAGGYVKALERREWIDRGLLGAGLALFFSTVWYILSKRF